MTCKVFDFGRTPVDEPFYKLLEQEGGKGKEYLAIFVELPDKSDKESEHYNPRLPIRLTIHDDSVACDGVGPCCDASAYMQPGTARKLAKLLIEAADRWQRKEK